MHICMLVKTESLIYDARVRKEAETLANVGHKVDIIVLKDPSAQSIKGIDGCKVYEVHLWTRSLPQNALFLAIKYLEFIFKLILAGLKIKADIYHCHNLNTLLQGFIIARLIKRRLVYDAHELWAERPGAGRRLMQWLEKFLLRRADASVAAERHRAEIMYEEYGATEMPVVIGNFPKFKTLESRSSSLRDFVKAQCGRSEAMIVLEHGRLMSERSAGEIIEALRYLDEEIVLVLLGFVTEEFREVLQNEIKRYNLDNRVFFHKPVPHDEVFSLISSADICTVLYKNTGRNNYYCAPNRLFESLMAGVPVIASNFPGMRDVVEKNNVGACTNPENPKNISKTVRYVLNNRDLMSQNALKMAKLKYNWEKEAPKLLHIYNRLLKNQMK